MLQKKDEERIERAIFTIVFRDETTKLPSAFHAFMQFPTSLTASNVSMSCQATLIFLV